MKGTYVLVIEVVKNSGIEIGKLGKVSFEKGFYAYVGSAMNNLEKRIQRHFSSKKKKFWHIDYLLSSKNVMLKGFYFKSGNKKIEHAVAEKIQKFGKAVDSFGCSDCKCKSHLFFISPRKLKETLRGFSYAEKPFV